MPVDRSSQPWLTQYDLEAHPDDILACFRLILGRNPNPEEWTGHLGAVGQDLGAVVANYLGSVEFERRGLLKRKPDGAIRRVRREGYDIFASETDEAVGRHVVHGTYEPHVAAVLRQRLRPGMGMLDVGANIGVFALLAASLVGPGGYVLAMEPNPGNARLLEASRRANGFSHLTVCQAAAARSAGVLALHSFDSNGTVTPVDDDALLTAQTVAALTVDSLVPAGQAVDVIKIDVEGAEHSALFGAAATLRRCRPAIVSEYSPGLLQGVSGIDGIGYLRFLAGLGYDLGVIGPGGRCSAGQTAAQVHAAYEAAGVDHIDIIALP